MKKVLIVGNAISYFTWKLIAWEKKRHHLMMQVV